MERSIDELIELLNDKDDFVVEDAVGELELRAGQQQIGQKGSINRTFTYGRTCC